MTSAAAVSAALRRAGFASITPTVPATVKADDGTVLTVPPAPVLAAYAVAMYGEGHGPLDDGTPEAHDALVSIAAQAALDATSGNDPYGVFGGGQRRKMPT